MKRTKMMTKEIERKFKKIGRQEDVEDPIVVAKYFNPYGRSTWYATEFDPESRCFFGYVVGEWTEQEDEWGYFNLDELEQLRVKVFGGRTGLPLERDLYFSMVPMSKACPDAFTKLGRDAPNNS